MTTELLRSMDAKCQKRPSPWFAEAIRQMEKGSRSGDELKSRSGYL